MKVDKTGAGRAGIPFVGNWMLITSLTRGADGGMIGALTIPCAAAGLPTPPPRGGGGGGNGRSWAESVIGELDGNGGRFLRHHQSETKQTRRRSV